MATDNLETPTPHPAALVEQDFEDEGLKEPDEIFGSADAVKPAAKSTLPPSATPSAAVPTPAAVPQQPVQTHPETLVRRAMMLGLPEDQITSLSTEALDDIVFNLHRKEVLLENQHLRSQGWQPQPEVTPAPSASPLPPVEESDDDLLTYAQRELGMDPKLVNLLRRHSERLKAVDGRTKKVDELEQRETQRQVRSNEDAYDAAFEQLIGEDPVFEQFFGKGDGRQLVKGSPEIQFRLAALQAAGLDQALDSPVAIQRKVLAASRRMFAKHLKGKAPVAPAAAQPAAEPGPYDSIDKPGAQPAAPAPSNGSRITQEQWDKGALSKPTQRGKQAVTRGEKAAVEAVRNYYREKGFTEDDEEVQLAGIPKQ